MKKSSGSVLLLIIAIVAIAKFKEYWPYIVGGIAFVVLLIVLAYRKEAKQPYTHIGNRSTKTYHLRSCRTLSNVAQSNLVGFRSADQARRKGYKPCNICKP